MLDAHIHQQEALILHLSSWTAGGKISYINLAKSVLPCRNRTKQNMFTQPGKAPLNPCAYKYSGHRYLEVK